MPLRPVAGPPELLAGPPGRGTVRSTYIVNAPSEEGVYTFSGMLRDSLDRAVQLQLSLGEPVISVDTKKKELVGPFKNGGRELRPKGRRSKCWCMTS